MAGFPNFYMTYGPFSLANATQAVIQFELLCNSELHGDSIFWGVSNSSSLAANYSNILIDSSFSGSTQEQLGQPWVLRMEDLSHLHTFAGVESSAVGLSTVYAFWWWKSNSNQVPDDPVHYNGAFVDNVLIQWDDGAIDLDAEGVLLTDVEGETVGENVNQDDSLRSRFTWTTCAGGVEGYPDVRL